VLPAGSIVYFNLHMFKPGIREENPYISGNYLVTNLKHEFTTENYYMTMDLNKDALESSIVLPENILTEKEVIPT